MSNKHQKSLVFLNAAAARRAAASYRKQFDLGLDGLPRQRGQKPRQAKEPDMAQSAKNFAPDRSRKCVERRTRLL